MDWKLFISTFTLIFVAELPDKTAFATLLLATRKSPIALFIGVAAAFVIQSLVAVTCGTALGFLPHAWVQIGSGLLFLVFALLMWIRNEAEEESSETEDGKDRFWSTVYSSFIVIFIAEWGDLTQFATATLAAKNESPLTIFLAAVLALWSVTAIAIIVGSRAKNFIQPTVLKKIAAIAFAGVGIVILYRSLAH
jgi:putative Ca2+/H+ antiporter (TMEM165/GDT1 family)